MCGSPVAVCLVSLFVSMCRSCERGYLYNKAHHRRPHDGVLAAWADAMRAPANQRAGRAR